MNKKKLIFIMGAMALCIALGISLLLSYQQANKPQWEDAMAEIIPEERITLLDRHYDMHLRGTDDCFYVVFKANTPEDREWCRHRLRSAYKEMYGAKEPSEQLTTLGRDAY